MDYKDSGVDIHAGYKAVELMKSHIARTVTKGVCSDVGGFGGLFELELTGIKKPVLVSGTDGVGTKLKLAFSLDKHDTIGIDCVAMCVNDIICSGAKPLFFLDYIACGKNVPEKIEQIVKGVCDGCVQAGAALIDKDAIIDNSKIECGDIIIGIASSGVHSNGFSLVRKVFDIDKDKTLARELLVPTKIYVKPVLALLKEVNIKGISHITGGGFYENIPRMLPDGICAEIEKNSIKILPIFEKLAKDGNIDEYNMFNTFNMGIGMAIVVDKNDVDKALSILRAHGEDAYIIGTTASKSQKIIIK